MQKNPYLKTLCRSLYDFQKVRIQIGNRLSKEGKDAETLTEDARNSLLDHYKEVSAVEKSYTKTIQKALKECPVYVQYLSKIKGCGPMMSGIVVSEVDDILRFPTVSKLWSYCGYGIYDGQIQKRTKGEKSNWNAFFKTKLFVLAGSFLKQKEPHYTKLYNDYKHRLKSRPCCHLDAKRHGAKVDEQGCTDGHRHAMAMRYMIKMFLKDLYMRWYEIEGVTPRAPYQEAYLGHKHDASAFV